VLLSFYYLLSILNILPNHAEEGEGEGEGEEEEEHIGRISEINVANTSFESGQRLCINPSTMVPKRRFRVM